MGMSAFGVEDNRLGEVSKAGLIGGLAGAAKTGVAGAKKKVAGGLTAVAGRAGDTSRRGVEGFKTLTPFAQGLAIGGVGGTASGALAVHRRKS